MQVKSIAECSKGSILQYFRPSLGCRFPLRPLFCLFLSGRLRQVLLYTSFLQTFFEETSMDSQQFQECVFYLRTYGSYLSVVDFHRRHGYYMKAVQYILDHVS